MDGIRSALIVASDEYTDPGLRRLRAPASDARALAAVLRDPGIGGFEVRTLLNEPAHVINLAVEEFFADRRPDDLLVIHFSCHGVKDEDGELYFATSNTVLRRLGATAVAADFVNRRMSRSRSRRIVLLLDCCYAGAFERGLTARAGAAVGIEEQFGGRGRAVITASGAMEYAFEGDELADTRELAPSVFTSALVEGLETGDADRDQDGLVALDELYDYIFDKVRAATPNQTPGKWAFGVQGELVIARRARPVTTPALLPRELEEAIESPLAAVRAAVVPELARLRQGRHAGLAIAARLALERLTEDDSRTVAAAAAAALSALAQPPAPSRLELSATIIDFGRLPLGSKSPERRIRLGNAGGGTLNARAATQASWLRLRQVGDDLVITVDTSAAAAHEDIVSIDSDAGAATVRVQAIVEATPTPAPAAPPDAAPAATGRDQPGAQQDAARPGPSSAPADAAPHVAAATPAPITPVGAAEGLQARPAAEAEAAPPTARQPDSPAPRQTNVPPEARHVSATPSAPSKLEPSRPAGEPGKARPVRRWRRRHARVVFAGLSLLAAVAILVPILTSRGALGPATGPATLHFDLYPDASDATAKAVASCNAQSHGKYTISYQQLPPAADEQRQQLVRRLAARDSTVDIMGLDVSWVAEFAQIGWILPWTGTNRQLAEADTLKPMLDTATWHGKLYAVPDNTNTQLLWYRSDLVPNPPTTWAQMISDAEQLARQGKPHYIEIQGAPYEGATVWFNTMLASAGGSVLTPDAAHVALGEPAIKALTIMHQLATSVAADPSLATQQENDSRTAMEAGKAAFELNYPFVYPSMKADKPKLFSHFKWAPFPEAVPGQPAHVTAGGIDLAVSAYSRHPQLAFQAALCLRNKANQLTAAIEGGVPPTLISLYSDQQLIDNYPYHADMLDALETASVRPKTPAYQTLSADISHLVSPPAAINPTATEQQMVSQITKALQSKGL